jgi:hypothetical protein
MTLSFFSYYNVYSLLLTAELKWRREVNSCTIVLCRNKRRFEVAKENGKINGIMVSKLKLGIIIGAGIVILLGAAAGCYFGGFAQGYQTGYTQGKADGDKVGYERGYAAGTKAGYDQGYAAGTKSGYDQGYQAGKKEGYDQGYQTGKDDGYKTGQTDGYNSGYMQGCASCSSPWPYFRYFRTLP